VNFAPSERDQLFQARLKRHPVNPAIEPAGDSEQTAGGRPFDRGAGAGYAKPLPVAR
jgi:hypothetical protein